MSDKELVGTFYSDSHKYEVVKFDGGFGVGVWFQVLKDGERIEAFRDLRKAVEYAKDKCE